MRCATQEKHLSKISLEPHLGRSRPTTWGRKDEEYIADFSPISRKYLDDFEHRLFRYHFLLGADWKLCTRKLGIDRGNFFHSVYRIEQKLGRIFRELEPYGLFPLDEYFHGPIKMIPERLGPVRLQSSVRSPLPRRLEHLQFPAPLGKIA
jgi:hypothetical protein